MIIDTHSHHVPEAMLDDLVSGRASFPSVELLAEDGKYPPRLRRRQADAAGHAGAAECGAPARLDGGAGGRLRQVCAGWLDSFGYSIPAEEGLAWSRFVNEHLSRAAGENTGFVPLATVPLQDGETAARALEEAMGQGFSGAMIGTQPKGGSGKLDDPELDPFWQAASDLGAVLYLHPMFGSDDERLHDFGMMNAVGRVTDETIAAARLLYAGHMFRFPGMKLILSLGGAALPYVLGRVCKNYEDDEALVWDPREGLKRMYFDSIVYDPPALRYLIDLVGADRVVLGSDYPFAIGDLEPSRVVRDSALDAEATEAILGGTAAELFGVGRA